MKKLKLIALIGILAVALAATPALSTVVEEVTNGSFQPNNLSDWTNGGTGYGVMAPYHSGTKDYAGLKDQAAYVGLIYQVIDVTHSWATNGVGGTENFAIKFDYNVNKPAGYVDVKAWYYNANSDIKPPSHFVAASDNWVPFLDSTKIYGYSGAIWTTSAEYTGTINLQPHWVVLAVEAYRGTGFAYVDNISFKAEGVATPSPPALPLPPSVLLLGSGILGLVGLGWRRRKTS